MLEKLRQQEEEEKRKDDEKMTLEETERLLEEVLFVTYHYLKAIHY